MFKPNNLVRQVPTGCTGIWIDIDKLAVGIEEPAIVCYQARSPGWEGWIRKEKSFWKRLIFV